MMILLHISPAAYLLFVVISIDVEVPEFVGLLVWGNNVQEVTELLLLQVLLGQVLEVSLGEWQFSSNVDLGLFAGDLKNSIDIVIDLSQDNANVSQDRHCLNCNRIDSDPEQDQNLLL